MVAMTMMFALEYGVNDSNEFGPSQSLTSSLLCGPLVNKYSFLKQYYANQLIKHLIQPAVQNP